MKNWLKSRDHGLSGMPNYAILRVLRNNRTLCLTFGAKRSYGQTISADISPFSLPYHGGLQSAMNIQPRCLFVSSMAHFNRRYLDHPRLSWDFYQLNSNYQCSPCNTCHFMIVVTDQLVSPGLTTSLECRLEVLY